MMEIACHFVPQCFSVVDEFDTILTGTDDDQEDCILAIDLIQDIKPGEGEELSDVSPWNAMVHLEMDVNVSCIALKSGIGGTMHDIPFIPLFVYE
jgi:hypothetical protein